MPHRSRPRTQVLKFGSSVLRTETDLPEVVRALYQRFRSGIPAVAVISAFRGRTDELLALADRIGAESPSAPALIGLGELEAAAAVTVALERAGLPAQLIDPQQIGITAEGDPLESQPVRTDAVAIRRALEAGAIPVVPGYVARNRAGRPVVLGRGGSDLTAICLAHALDADAVLIKGAGAVYEWDPAERGPSPRRFHSIDYDDALALGDRVLQPRAIRYARDTATPFIVTGISDDSATVVRHGPTRLVDAINPYIRTRRRTRIALLGLGTVGAGVAHHLAQRTDRVDLLGALVRDPARSRALTIEGLPLTTDPAHLLELRPDIVVETIGGTTVAHDLVAAALEAGAEVVTANKALLAEFGHQLHTLAARRRRRLLSSAAVGGALPVLELIARARAQGRITRVRGIFNGTTNFVLGRVALGDTLQHAIEQAQQRGLAEADPSADLSGLDAAHKLTLIARAAGIHDFGHELVTRERIDADAAPINERATVKHIAELDLTNDEPAASVRLLALDPSDPLAAVDGPANAIHIHLDTGETVTARAHGAGRWPTALAVIADIDDLIDEPIAAAGPALRARLS
ncbi:MAG: homoserine dehydrogenase [Phycisphaerales bacterium]